MAQRQALLELKAERDARPKAIAWCENDGETVFLCVRNIGLLGACYATLNVKGPVHNAKRDGYAWWTHTNRQKTNIPHGAEFKAKLAVLEWTGQMARWTVFAVNDDIGLIERPAVYSSCPTSTTITKAPDLVVSGRALRTGLSQRPSSILCDVGRVRGPRSTLH